ncbi:interleukin-18 [Esox lucius]|uniref:interleukin-18 n=1 Tax=Esox lucius TaxID=8010 RepID=UPI000576B7BF|nr:interleukin-18 [Esox lucius]
MMASKNSSTYECVDFAAICDENIIFENVCYESDDFKTDGTCQSGIMRNKRSQCLVIDGDSFQFESKNNQELQSPGGNFVIRIQKYYCDGTGDEKCPVTISVQDRVVACYENGDKKGIKAKPLVPIPSIEGNKHESIFYKQEIQGTRYFKFESSLFPTWFLAFSESSGLLALKFMEEVDETCEIEYKESKPSS